MLTEKMKVMKKFVFYSIGYFLTYGSYYAILFLQSSINIEDGLGATSAAVTYSCSVAFGLLLTPAIIRVFGAKYAAIICQTMYLIYVLANYYPVVPVLIPASVLVGIGEATMWPTMILFSVHYARCYANHNGKARAAYETVFVGYFFFGFQLSQIFANLLSYAILYGGKSKENTTLAENLTVEDFSLCGIRDCQNPNVTQQNIDMYIPTSQLTLNIVIGVMAGMIFAAGIIYLALVKDINAALEQNDAPPNTVGLDAKVLPGTSNESSLDRMVENKGVVEVNTEQTKFSLICSTWKATIRHVFCLKQILLAPFALYSGVLMAFGYSELTRAFASCLLGVDQIGLCMAIFSVSGGISSVLICKLSSRVGRNIPVIAGICIDVSSYIFLLLWKPSVGNLTVVYVTFIAVGTVNGIWQPLISEIHGEFFPQNQDVAFPVWNMWVLAGYAVQYGWSTSLCVNVKIYAQLGILFFSALAYGAANHLQNKTEKSQQENL